MLVVVEGAHRSDARRRRSRPSRRDRARARSGRRPRRVPASPMPAPSRVSSLPRQSGRKPWGSRTPITWCASSSVSENAPSKRGSTSSSACSRASGRTGADALARQGDLLGHGLGVAADGAGQHPRVLRQLRGVDQVPVVRERELRVGNVAVDRLGVLPHARSGGRVAGVADRQVPVERGQGPVVEHVRHQAHVLDDGQVVAVGGGDARRLLAPVLQCVDPQIRQVRNRGCRARTRRTRRRPPGVCPHRGPPTSSA